MTQTPKTVNAAFTSFLKDKVNLESTTCSNARTSRDWLLGKINEFPEKDSSFPNLYSGADIWFGSFARNTKIRPLDDIDMMVGLNAEGSWYNGYSYTDISIHVPDSSKRLRDLCHDYTDKLNSIKVVNKFVSNLKTIPQYSKSDIKRNQEAAVLKLSSYEWNFDIVPSFITAPDSVGENFYLIPDGKGHWKKTDPRKDRDRTKRVNQNHEGNVLNVIRITKYWNKRPTMPSMSSYLMETMILDYYEFQKTNSTCSKFVDIEIPAIFQYIRDHIYNDVEDPKGIQGNINDLCYEIKQKIYDRADLDYRKALEARRLEGENDHPRSIRKWREIFGPEFG